MSASNDQPQALDPLLSGRGSFSREQVDDIQRVRIISAMVEVVAGVGYLRAAVAPVVARAGVSRRTFYELFDGREDCFLAAFEWGVGQARPVMAAAYGSQRTWRERTRHGLAALLILLDSEPELARVCVIEALGAGRLVLERRVQVLEEIVAALGASAPQARGAGQPLLLTAEGVVGGVFSLIHSHLLEHRKGADSLIALHGQLMALIVLPYLGPRAAGEELTRPVPKLAISEKVAAGGSRSRRLLERLGMRLTYSTVRCLVFIGGHPGSSNREVALGAEIPDEGQTSKLLGRLSNLGLIANSRPHGPGHPNHWTLTSQGEQVLAAARGR